MEQDLKEMQGVCKPELMTVIGMQVDKTVKQRPFIAGPAETDYCRRSKYSCCKSNEFESVALTFSRSIKQLQTIFEPIQELLVLFEGERYKYMIEEVSISQNQRLAQCGKHVIDLEDVNGYKFNLLENTVLTKTIEEINSLLVETEFYLKRQGWFYGNLICTVCSPGDQKNFEIVNGELKLKTKIHTCNEILDMFEFEVRLMKVYQLFLKPFADYYNCVQRLESRVTDIELPPIDLKLISDMSADFDQCYFKITHENQSCLKICAKNPTEYTISYGLRNLYSKALKFYFPLMTPMRIESFYLSIKGRPFEEHYQNSVVFYPMFGASMNRFLLSYQEKGANVFSNEWSKKYEEIAVANVSA